MYSQFLSADADGFLGSATIQEEDLVGLTLRNEANWDAKDEWDEEEEKEGRDPGDDENWDDEDLDDEEEDDLDDDDEDWDDDDWDDDDEEWEG